MATLYKIEIKTVSAFVNYDEKYMTEMFMDFITKYKDPKTKLGFEATEIDVQRF